MTETADVGKGTRAVMHQIASPAAERFATVEAHVADMRFVRQCLEELQQTAHERRDPRALWSAAVVAYARCFASGVRGVIEPRMLATFPGADEVHQWLLDIRNKHVAHSVSPFEQSMAGVFITREGKIGTGVLTMHWEGPGEDDLSGLIRLVDWWLAHLSTARHEAWTAFKAEAQALSVVDVEALPVARLTAPGSEWAGKSRAGFAG